MKERSTNGLLVHIFGKLALAFLYLIFLTLDSHHKQIHIDCETAVCETACTVV